MSSRRRTGRLGRLLYVDYYTNLYTAAGSHFLSSSVNSLSWADSSRIHGYEYKLETRSFRWKLPSMSVGGVQEVEEVS
jgi:hypothetical protein